MYIPNIDVCDEIVKENECFISKTEEVNGYNVRMYNYLLAEYNDFLRPLKDNPEVTAFELRGLTFIQDPKDNSWRRFLMLHKFFNIDQCKDYLLEDLRKLEFESALDKRDGSMIRFVQFPDGKIVAKTKMGFNNDQAKLAQRLYDEDKNLQEFVKASLGNNLAAIFELTSPVNRIVISYKKSELTLLQLRDETSGLYHDLKTNSFLKNYKINLVDDLSHMGDLDYFLKKAETLTDSEGYILGFRDKETNEYKMAKRKTPWYMERHGLLTDSLSRENIIAHLILDNNLDDTMAILDKDDPRREVMIGIEKIFLKYITHKIDSCINFVKENFKGDRKSFAIKNNKEKDFMFWMKIIDVDDAHKREKLEQEIIFVLKKTTYRLENARKFFKEELNYSLEDNVLSVEGDE